MLQLRQLWERFLLLHVAAAELFPIWGDCERDRRLVREPGRNGELIQPVSGAKRELQPELDEQRLRWGRVHGLSGPVGERHLCELHYEGQLFVPLD